MATGLATGLEMRNCGDCSGEPGKGGAGGGRRCGAQKRQIGRSIGMLECPESAGEAPCEPV